MEIYLKVIIKIIKNMGKGKLYNRNKDKYNKLNI